MNYSYMEFLDDIYDEINTTNNEMFEFLKSKPKRKQILCTTTFLKIAFSSNILEDITLLNALDGNSLFKKRHANLIIRQMVEQVVEFCYLMQNQHLIKEYMGMNIPLKKLPSNPEKALTYFSSKRFSNGRRPISKMAHDIGEKGSDGLYGIYSILSEETHNAYFHANGDMLDEIETGKEPLALTKLQISFITIVLCRFMEAYRE